MIGIMIDSTRERVKVREESSNGEGKTVGRSV